MKEPNVQKLKRIADKVFSEFIRQRDEGICFTCGLQKDPKYQQCGHYVSRSFNQLRYSEINCNTQCVGCNVFKHGAMDSYALALQGRHGSKVLATLAEEKKKVKQFTVQELLELIEKYKEKIKNL